MTINAFFGWDFNSCEALRQDTTWFPIDFANPCPDSQVTSLHYHFPWLIGANLRWSLFCAATKRPVRPNLDWQPFFDIADTDASYPEKLSQYAALARTRLQADEFDEFCDAHLSHLDEILHDFFGSDMAHDAVRQKVVAMYPEHEVDDFTEMFWQRIQDWRNDR